jgi:hypothetical protein
MTENGTTCMPKRATPDQCPSWCTLTPGHDWDGIHPDGTMSRGHAGPRFGRFLSAGSIEHESGVTGVAVEIHTEDGDDNELTTAHLLDLAADALVAAEWLEAHR